MAKKAGARYVYDSVPFEARLAYVSREGELNQDAIMHLLHDPSPEIRAIAVTKCHSRKALDRLLSDENPSVCEAARNAISRFI